MALFFSWAVGLVVLVVVGMGLDSFVSAPLTTTERLSSFGWRLVLIHLPNLVGVAVATWAAARAHREPFRHRTGRHLCAALPVPVVALLSMLGTLAVFGGAGVPVAVLLMVAVCAVGAAAGFLMDRLQEDRR